MRPATIHSCPIRHGLPFPFSSPREHNTAMPPLVCEFSYAEATTLVFFTAGDFIAIFDKTVKAHMANLRGTIESRTTNKAVPEHDRESLKEVNTSKLQL